MKVNVKGSWNCDQTIIKISKGKALEELKTISEKIIEQLTILKNMCLCTEFIINGIDSSF